MRYTGTMSGVGSLRYTGTMSGVVTVSEVAVTELAMKMKGAMAGLLIQYDT